MRLEEFKCAVHAAGWRDSSDAQHEGIKKLHAELFPSVAKLEGELEDARWSYLEAIERTDC